MVVYARGEKGDEADILDFINYVFSQSYRPHDFRKMLPKVYAQNDFAHLHYMAKENGRILGVVGMLPIRIRMLGDDTMSVGYVGSVSVHPYARGEGYMKNCMRLMMSEAQAQGMDLLALGGQRQRYGYYGFERGGANLSFEISPTNIRHTFGSAKPDDISFREILDPFDPCLDALYALYQKQPMLAIRPKEQFVTILHSWCGRLYAVLSKGIPSGYLYVKNDVLSEIALESEDMLCDTLRAWIDDSKAEKITVPVQVYQRERAAVLKSICESYSIRDAEMIKVLNWEKVLKTTLSLKNEYCDLEDGSFSFSVDGEGYALRVKDGVVSAAREAGETEADFTEREAIEWFFSPYTQYMGAPMPRGWLPLPCAISSADTF